MFKRVLSIIVAGLLVNLVSVSPAIAGSLHTQSEKSLAELKKTVAKLGIGREARIAVTLADKTEVTGYVSEAADDYFVVTDSVSGAATRIQYSDVTNVKALPTTRNELTPKRAFKQMALAGGIVIGVLVILCVASRRCAE